MAFDTHYPNRKDRRRPLRKSKAFDRSCRNHGSCPYCRANRQDAWKRRLLSAEEQMTQITHEEAVEFHAIIMNKIEILPPPKTVLANLMAIAASCRDEAGTRPRATELLESFADDIEHLCEVWEAQHKLKGPSPA